MKCIFCQIEEVENPNLVCKLCELTGKPIPVNIKFGTNTNCEICICAAIKDTEGYIWRGHRHIDCLDACQAAGKKPPMASERIWQGFITSYNRFVNRYEGYKLQIAAGIQSVADGGYRGNRLFSEDLY